MFEDFQPLNKPLKSMIEFPKHRSGVKTILSDEHWEEILRLYKEDGVVIYKLARLSGKPSANIAKFLRSRGLEVKNRFSFKKQYKINESFFEHIDTEGKAYLFGFLMADGGVYENRITLSIHRDDVEILEILTKEMESSYPIAKHQGKNNMMRVNFCSDKLTKDLYELGCTSKKSLTLEFKENIIPDNLIHHFIRGFFDGDGSVSFGKSRGRMRWEWEVVGTSQFLNKIEEVMSKIGLSFNKIRKTENIYRLRIGMARTEPLKLIYNFLYNGAKLFLKRKKSKIEIIFKEREDFVNSRPNIEKYNNQYRNNVQRISKSK